jgi:hypothetical protein
MSTLRVNTIQNSGGTGSPEINGLARAWVNFNGEGTVAIRASSNVSSITDNGTGDYTVNFITSMPDVNYSFVASCSSAYGVVRTMLSIASTGGTTEAAPSASAMRFSNTSPSAVAYDTKYVSVAVFR